LNNVFRKDEVKDSIPRTAIEEMVPEFKNGHIVVPKIIE
jgi:aspartyl/glutamyl-tRNA(Asn/Gln) amidotransferase C subunit